MLDVREFTFMADVEEGALVVGMPRLRPGARYAVPLYHRALGPVVAGELAVYLASAASGYLWGLELGAVRAMAGISEAAQYAMQQERRYQPAKSKPGAKKPRKKRAKDG